MTEMAFAHLLARKWLNEDIARGPKPTAKGTPFRYSDAHGCSRKMQYSALNATTTEPWDAASAWVTNLGTLLHEHLQEAIAEQAPNAQFEVASQVNEYLSGSCDGYIPGPLGIGNGLVLEIKTVGQYVFNSQAGYGNYKRTEPKGPKWSAIVQAGMNAIGIERGGEPEVEFLALISLAKEAVSVNKAKTLGITDPYERFAQEWWFPRHEWEGPALEEINRITQIAEDTKDGLLVQPSVVEDDLSHKNITPGSYWACDYCPFRTLCEQDAGTTHIEASYLTVLATSEEK